MNEMMAWKKGKKYRSGLIAAGFVIILGTAGFAGSKKTSASVIEKQVMAEQTALTGNAEKASTVSEAYKTFVKGLGTKRYYAVEDIGAEHPVLLVSKEVYKDPDTKVSISMSADIYYLVDGHVKLLDTISSNGTAYAVSTDGQGFYVGGNHWGAKYVIDDEKKRLVIAEQVHVSYDTHGNATYSHEINGVEQGDGERAFEQFYDQYNQKAKEIAFTKASHVKS